LSLIFRLSPVKGELRTVARSGREERKMIPTKVTETSTLSGFVPAGKPRRSYRGLPKVLALAAALLSGAMATPTAQAQTFKVLHTFTGGADGGVPKPDFLVWDTEGSLYGTTVDGGAECCGVVFKVDTAGQEAVLYSFTGGTDGGSPYAGVLRDAAGSLYGTTCCSGADGAGVVFKIDAAGKETVLHAFTGGSDGGWPYAGLAHDNAGNLYGVSSGGGDFGKGVVFEVDTAGAETVLHSFTGRSDGGDPPGRLVLDTAGNLYGVTASGGELLCPDGCGVVFKLTPGGTETVLHYFAGYPLDGSVPEEGLTMDSAGNIYGTTGFGGASNKGTVFKLDASGNETVLYSFTGGADGASPYAPLVLDKAGNLYGTTYSGGDTGGLCGADGGCGVVFKLDTAGKETVLHTFTGEDGLQPRGALLPDAAGNLYGTTSIGGDVSGCGGVGCGVVFKLTP
jgi:uncharacterized repeat protein (TIGR03803 family)